MNDPSLYKRVDTLNKQAWDSMTANPKKGLSLSREARRLAVIGGYEDGIAESQLNEGWCCIYLGDFHKALEVLEEGFERYEALENNEKIMKTLNALGVVYTKINRYDIAIDYYSNCREIALKTNNTERLASAIINIGIIYLELGNNEEALKLFKQTLELEKLTKEQNCVCFLSVGDAYRNLKSYTSALEYYNKAVILAVELNDKIEEANCLTSMGHIYKECGDNEKAEEYLKKSLQIAYFTKDKPGVVESLTNLGNLLYHKGELHDAEKFHKKAIKLSGQINSKLFESKNYQGLSEIYVKMGDYQKALEYHRKFDQSKSLLLSEETEKKLSYLSVQHEIEKSREETKTYQQLNRELTESYNRITMISQIGQKITSSLDMEKIMYRIYENVKILMNSDIFGIALYDSINRDIDYKFFMEGDKRAPEFKINIDTASSFASWCIRNKNNILLNDVQKEFKEYLPKGNTHVTMSEKKENSLIFLPLEVAGNIIGIITVQSYKKNAYDGRHLELLTALGSYIAIAIENSKIHEKLNSLSKMLQSEKEQLEDAYRQITMLANHDNLTGLPNKRLLSELLRSDMPQALRRDEKIALIYIDLDNFKPVNDIAGHDCGDNVLVIVAKRFLSTIRTSDTIARIGGDEFVGIIRKVGDNNDVIKVVKKIIEQIAQPITIYGSSFHIGASIGISMFPEDDSSLVGLLKKADIAMYTAKHSGKNTFKFYKELSRN